MESVAEFIYPTALSLCLGDVALANPRRSVKRCWMSLSACGAQVLVIGSAAGATRVRAEDELEFLDYVEGSMRRHFRVAVLLTGNQHDADDLVQHALIQLYPRWRRLVASGSPDAYVRKTMTNKLIDVRRSAYMRHEERRADVPDEASDADLLSQLVDDRAQISAALSQLSPFRRAVIVLRWYEELSVDEAAETLGCSTSKIKRSTSEALLQMRQLLRTEDA